MGALIRVGYARLDRWVDEAGDGGVMNEVCSRVAEGETLKEIARTVGMPYSVLWNWLQGEGRMELYRQAKEAAAEALADEVLQVADTSEVVRDRVDARKWLAGKWARDRKSTRMNSSHESPSRMPSSAWKKYQNRT